MATDPRSIDAWARRVRMYDGEAEYRQLLDELAASPQQAVGILDRLAEVRDPIVRAWAGTAAAAVFGREAVPLLTRLLKDRDLDVRDIARQDLVALDPDFERQFFPAYRRALKRRKDAWGEDRVAMFNLARVRDPEAVSLLRAYASHHEPSYWHDRMPLVLADYIEDPMSVTRRIRDHDHDFMFWLAEAAAILDVPNREEAFTAAFESAMDDACAAIVGERLRLLREASSRDIAER